METRLRFKNLKDDVTLNNFLPSEMDRVWVPKLIFSNTEEKPSTVVDDEATIYAEKQGDYELSPEDEMENIKYYNGHENQLHMQRFYNQRQFSILILLETFINLLHV